MSGLRHTPFHRALHRPNLIWGGDRELMLFTLMISGVMVIASMNMVSFIAGLVLGSFCVYVLRRMAKADPLMRQVYLRQAKYNRYYPPFSRPWRVSKSTRAY